MRRFRLIMLNFDIVAGCDAVCCRGNYVHVIITYRCDAQ